MSIAKTGQAALVALRSPDGRFKLREITEFLASKLGVSASIPILSRIENDNYPREVPAMVALGLIIMHNVKMARHSKLPLPAKLHICCRHELEPDEECPRCKGKNPRKVVDVRKLAGKVRA